TELHDDVCKRQRMRQRNELGSALRRLNRRDARHAEHVALTGRSFADQSQSLGKHGDASARTRDAPRRVLLSDVDHVRLSGGIKMGKMRALTRHLVAPETLR